jgi:hypothetical protein
MGTNITGDHYAHCLRFYLRREISICFILPTVQTQDYIDTLDLT